MDNRRTNSNQSTNRRSFLKKGVLGAGAAAVGAGLLANGSSTFGQGREEGNLSKGDVAILQLLLAAEIIETDLWQQYKELGGIEVANNPTFQPYVNGLLQLDGDMPQYISDNTDDEISHVNFLREYLKSKGQEPINLDKFAHNLAPSSVPGVAQTARQPEAIESGYQLVDSLPKQGKRRPRRAGLSASRAKLE
jgi:hypothetical protein